MTVDGGSIECVKEFQYLGSKAFGALRKAVFTNTNLSLTTKRQVYQACVLSVVQYGGECWILLRKHLRGLNAFHHRCIHTVLGITNMRQWEERITSRMTREQWEDQETITVKLMKRRLEWLGHLARMLDHRIPKKTLFSWLPQPCPHGGPRRRWRDLVKRDMKAAQIDESSWFEVVLHKGKWHTAYSDGLNNYQQSQLQQRVSMPRDVKCDACGRCFRRECDKVRHKCTAERSKPVCEQKGAVRCTICGRWFRSRGGIAVHRCGGQHQETDSQDDNTHTTSSSVAETAPISTG